MVLPAPSPYLEGHGSQEGKIMGGKTWHGRLKAGLNLKVTVARICGVFF